MRVMADIALVDLGLLRPGSRSSTPVSAECLDATET